MNKVERNHTIDVLKGVCIIFVIITHCNFSDAQRSWLLFPFWIDMAVPIFMFLSGYLWALSYKNHKLNDLKSCYNKKLIIKKVIRFILPFLIVFLVEEILLIIYNKSFNIKSFILDFICGGLGPGSYYTPLMIQLIILFPLIYIYIYIYRTKRVSRSYSIFYIKHYI